MNLMKNKTQTYLITLFFLLLTLSFQAQTIFYEYIGWSDRPMTSLKIKCCADLISQDSTKKYACHNIEKGYFLHEFIVEKETFDALVDFASENNSNEVYEKNTSYDYGSYKISFSEKDEIIEFVLLKSDKSRQFFEKQLVIVKDNNDLIKRFKSIILVVK
jgi:hypothetical protein